MYKLIILMLGLIASSAQAQEINSNPVLAVNAAQGSAVLGSTTEAISPSEAAKMLTEQQAIIVDVREDSEWNQEHIPGARHIPLGQLKDRIAELEQYKHTPIIMQCRSGKRSQQALIALKQSGFSKTYNLDGGIVAWDKAGFKTE